jgi:glutamate-1-semialdehyde 2,1-aminomutase
MTADSGTLLIFDEVITGFRLAFGGAQELFRISPDLTCLGKIVGGGLPLAAFGGRREIMDLLAPEGPVYQAGTLSGNPLAVTAGIATLEVLGQPGTYDRLERSAAVLETGFETVARERGLRCAINRVGSMMTVFFGLSRVHNAEDARQSDCAQFSSYFHGMLRQGIYFPPAQFEAAFVSLAHRRADFDRAVTAFDRWARKRTQR